MRARALFAGTVGALLLAIATPAAAKAMIAEAHIGGPGLGGGGLRISAPATEGMWESGIDVAVTYTSQGQRIAKVCHGEERSPRAGTRAP
jgi:hypothetical protein